MIEASLPSTARPSGAPSVEFIGATKRFGAMTALDNVSIKVQAGSVHALLGENGAGKSTLVKCLVGFYSADAGQIMFSSAMPSRARGVLPNCRSAGWMCISTRWCCWRRSTPRCRITTPPH